MASFFRDPILLSLVDEDNRVLAEFSNPGFVPRVGENVRIARVPHIVERVGYDIADGQITHVWVVCRPT